MKRHLYRAISLVCALTLTQSSIVLAGSSASNAQDATPAPVSSDLAGGIPFEPISRGTIDELLSVARLMRVSRVTLSPDASQATYTVLPALYAVEEGAIAFDVDRDLPAPAWLIRATSDGSRGRTTVVLPGTSIELDPTHVLVVPGVPDVEPPYSYISAGNRSDEPVTYIDIEIFPTSNYHVLSNSGDPAVERLDVSLGLETAQEPAPDWIVAGRLVLEPGESSPFSGGAPQLAVVQEGTVVLSVEEGEAAVQRSGSSWGDAPDALSGDDWTDLAEDDAAFLAPGTTGALTNSGSMPMTVLLVTMLTPEDS